MGTRLTPFAHDSRRAADTCALSLKWSFQLLLDLGGHRNLISRMRPAKSSTQPREARTWCALKFKWTPVRAF